jgi:uncharacterized membrane protein
MFKRIFRILKHRWQGDAQTQRAFPPQVLAKLTQLVADSEALHSGEIRIVVEAGLPTSYLWRSDALSVITRQRALAIFGKCRVWDTELNNGVLIYLLLAERRIEIVADRGVNQVVSPDTWLTLVSGLATAFRIGQYEEGMGQAVAQVGQLLQQHFPLNPGEHNPDELPNAPLLA